MDDIGVIVRAKPVTSRAEVIERLRARETEIRALGAMSLNLFGSAARNEMQPDSDVDLYFDCRADGSFTYYDLCDLEAFIRDALQRPVDVIARDGLHTFIRADIERDAIRVF
jgi:uncharacterized protein